MAEERVQRRLAAILAADLVGYSRLMGEDETGMLTGMLMDASFPDRGREHRTESVPPIPNRLLANIDAPLEQNIFDLPRQRIADIHHHREANYLRRAVEISEWIAHRRTLWNIGKRLKPIYSDNAMENVPTIYEATSILR